MADFASFWFGGPLSGIERLCIASFLAKGHRFDLYSYDPALVVPAGCRLRDASRIFPESKVFFYSESEGRKVSAFSNMFRYQLLFESGVCWVDTDVLCLSEDFVASPIVFARQDAESVNGAVLRFPAGHEAMRLAAEYCWEVRSTSMWGDLGPRLMTKVVQEYGLAGEATPTEWIYPLHWQDAARLFDPGSAEWVSSRIDGALVLHLWNETFGALGIDKRQMPPSGSYLAKVIREYGLESSFELARVAEAPAPAIEPDPEPGPVSGAVDSPLS